MMRSVRNAGIAFCLLLLLTACSSDAVGKTKYPSCNTIPQSKSYAVSAMGLVDGSLLYQVLDTDKSSYYLLDIASGSVRELGAVTDFALDTGAEAYFGGSLYFYVTVQETDGSLCNVLYAWEKDASEIVKVSEDRSSAPLLSLYAVPEGVLALKVNEEGNTCFEMVVSGEGPCSTVLLEAPPEEAYVIADVFEDHLYVFAYELSALSPESYRYFIRKISLRDYSEAAVIDLEAVRPYIEESRIGRMEIFGDYLFFENYSNIGLICRIQGDGVTKIAEEADLVQAKTFSGREESREFFYIRRTGDLFLFDRAAGELKPISLTLPNEEKIQVVFSDGNRVSIKAKTYSGLRITRPTEKVYTYEAHGLMEMP